MKQGTAALAAIALAAGLTGCAGMTHPSMHADAGWTTLIDGTHGMENFHRVGEATDRDAPEADLARLGQRLAKHRVARLVSLGHHPIKARPFESGNTLG